MKLRQVIAVGSSLCMIALQSNLLHADPISDATSRVVQDSTLIAQWMSDQLKVAVPYNSTSGNVVPKQLKIFGIELGAEGIVSDSKIDVNSFHNLPTTVVNTQSINMYSRFPMPSVMGHAKIGLPFGLDAGIRVGGIPTETFNNGSSHFDIRNSILGFDLRKVLIEEGVAKPFGLTVGANFTRAKGSMDLDTSYTANTFSNNGNTATITNGKVNSHSDWDTKSVGLQVILNKQLLFFNPYIGASANKNFGSVTTAVTETGNLSVNGASAGSPVLTGIGSATPNRWDLRALAGFELSLLPFLRLGVQGEYAGNQNLGGDIGLRFQFR